jgi:predicted Zn finger-like uncharacterized protein
MVIQCSACDTKFKISDDKVKNGPVKVRCSKCKEVFTVHPPEEEEVAAPVVVEASNSENPSPSLDDVDWGSLNSNEPEETAERDESSDFSFGADENDASDESLDFSFGDEETTTDNEVETDTVEFSFGDEESAASDEIETDTDEFSFGDDETDDTDPFSFGESSEASTDDFGFDEPVGEGAQDEFSFDETPAATGTADDFDWDGSSSDDGDSEDNFGFGEESDDNLDFSSLKMEQDEPASVEVESPIADAPQMVEPKVQPSSEKGPQKSGGKGRKSGQRRKAKKMSGPLRSMLTFMLFVIIIVGGGLYGLKQMGFWSGNFEELQTVDYLTAAKTAWEKGMVEVNKLAGNEVAIQAVGTITITEKTGRYIQNSSAGTLFIIEGKIRNDYNANRSAIAVQGTLYDATGTAVRLKKVYCGNVISNSTLQSGTVAEMDELSANPFGDRFSNEGVAPGTFVPFTIVFADLPDNLAEYNVEVTESAKP